MTMSDNDVLATARSWSRQAVRAAVRAAAALSVLGTTIVAVANTAVAQVSVTPSAASIGSAATKIQDVLDLCCQAALWGSLASILVGAAVWGLSKHFGNYGGANKGQILVLGGAAGALIASMAPAIINGLFS